MTRETKIGLLVGLAFILIVGILLSEHVTRSTETPQANLVNAGSTVREGVSAPGTSSVQPPITPITAEQAQPRQTVPTQQELRGAPTPANQVVQVATPSNPVVSASPAAPLGAQVGRPVAEPSPDATASTPGNPVGAVGGPVQPEPSPWDSLAGIAAEHGESVVLVNPRGNPQSMPPMPPRIETPPPAPVGTREYIAEAGDNLHKIALKTMGASTKANRDAIVRLNPSLQQSADHIIVGQRYLVPAVAGSQVASDSSRNAQRVPANGNARATTPAAPRRADASFVLYEVKPGDSLWRIAVNHTGSPAGIKLIRDMNPDVLTSDAVRVGMKLKLPKPPAGQTTARAD